MCDNSVDAQNMTVMDFMLHQYAIKLKTVYLHLINRKAIFKQKCFKTVFVKH